MGLSEMFHSSKDSKKDNVDVKEDEYWSDDASTLAEDVGVADTKSFVLFNNMDWHNNKLVKDEADNLIYFAEMHPMKISKYVILRDGGKEGPEVGRVSCNMWMTKFELTFGDAPAQLFKPEIKHWAYDWTLPDGRKVIWKSTRQNSINGDEKKTRFRWNFKLVDEETNQVLALFIATRSQWKKLGTLVIKTKYTDSYGPDFEKGVALGIITALEILQTYLNNSTASSSSSSVAAALAV